MNKGIRSIRFVSEPRDEEVLSECDDDKMGLLLELASCYDSLLMHSS